MSCPLATKTPSSQRHFRNRRTAKISHFRHHSYIHDQEIGLYYLQSRYYDAKVGRFLNADAYASTGQGILGCNMFAYCGNEPVRHADPTGHAYYVLGIESGNLTTNSMLCYPGGGGGSITHVAASRTESLNVIRHEKAYFRGAINFVNNTSEEKVLESTGLSFYRGIPVIRINGERSGYLGIICLTENATADTLRHEYGHSYQLSKLGLVKYLLCIGLPSWLEWGTQEYYERPWEVVADVEGGVLSRPHDQSTIQAGYDYLDASDKWGPLVWTTIE